MHHFGPEGEALWEHLHEHYEMTAADTHVCRALCEAFDTYCAAQALVREDGIVVEDRFGQKKPHPAVGIARDARAQVEKLTRALMLDGADAPTMPPLARIPSARDDR